MQNNCEQFARQGGGSGGKDDAGKSPLHLLPTESLEEIAKVYGYGAEKYAAHNWRGGMHWSRVFSACLRHLFAWWRGEVSDQESGLTHLSHAAFCILTLLSYEKTGVGSDDRYKAES